MLQRAGHGGPVGKELALPLSGAEAKFFGDGARDGRDVGNAEYEAGGDAGVTERLAKLGIVPLSMSQPEFQKYFEADVRETDELAKAAGIEKQ